ncbi:MAG: ComEC family competence protein [Bacteroidia bacterium]|nr:ComEC family competence protein [Bacteroidia bacterium]
MNRFGNIPFLRILIPFVAGILTATFSQVPEWVPVVLFIGGTLNVGIRILLSKDFPHSFEWITGVGISLLFFSIGILRLFIADDARFNPHYSRTEGITAVSGTILDELHEKVTSYKTTLKVETVRDSNGTWKPATGRMLFYFRKSAWADSLQYGDKVIILSSPFRIEDPQNPEEFNYRRYLSFHNISSQVYADEKRILKTGAGLGNPLIAFSLRLRQHFIGIFDDYLTGKQEKAVAAAIILGFRDNLDIEQINAFASAGALHVLAVSGMHVGIIFLILELLFRWIDKFKKIKSIKQFLLLLFIWFYAMLTGFSPSVLRASVMISVVLFGQLIYRKGNVYNSMFIAAFLLLIYNPYLITEVGFQLSFLAVFGIIAVHPVIFRWWEPEGWLLHKTWEITSVSIAAQLVTFPLGLLYFHQFPLLFFLSNLVVIPLAFIIMCAGLFLFFLSSIPGSSMLTLWFGKVLNGMIWLLNQSVFLVDRQATSVIREVTISISETWMIYLIILFIFLFITTRIPKQLISALVCIILLFGFQLWESWHQANRKVVTVYAVNKRPAYSFIANRNLIFITDITLLGNSNSMMFHVYHHWWAEGVKNRTIIGSDQKLDDRKTERNPQAVVFNKRRFLFLSQFPKLTSSELPLIRTDYLILSNGGYIDANSLTACVKAEKIILDSTFPKWKSKKLIEALGNNAYSVLHSGAYQEVLQ